MISFKYYGIALKNKRMKKGEKYTKFTSLSRFSKFFFYYSLDVRLT